MINDLVFLLNIVFSKMRTWITSGASEQVFYLKHTKLWFYYRDHLQRNRNGQTIA